MTATSLPLFPLRTVLFPGGTLALQVFEVRYLGLMRECQQQHSGFGVVCLSAGTEVRRAGAPSEQFHPVGTLALVEELEAVQPGLLFVQARGRQRFRATEPLQQPNGLWVAQISLLPDDLPCAVPEDLHHCVTRLKTLMNSAEPGEPKDPAVWNDCGWVANRWCERLPLALTQRQQLLALDNPLLRLELVNDFLGQIP